jgi:cell wall-associated NlpC family hydrolase
MRRAILAALAAVAIVLSLLAATGSARAAVHVPARPSRAAIALRWAEAQAGKWYSWGGIGPSTYDCSGLVMEAYRHAGVSLPRTTYSMLADWNQLVRVSHPQPGDLAFYVELYYGGHQTFGAHSSGERIGRITWGSYWHPTVFMRVR